MGSEKEFDEQFIEIETNNYHIAHDLGNATIGFPGGLCLKSTKKCLFI